MFRNAVAAAGAHAAHFLRAQGAVTVCAAIVAACLAIAMLASVMSAELDYSAQERIEQTIIRELQALEPGARPTADTALPQITAQPSAVVILPTGGPVPQSRTALGQALRGIDARLSKAGAAQFEHIYLDAALAPTRTIWGARWLLAGTAEPFGGEFALYALQSLIEEQRFIDRLKPVLWMAALFVAGVTVLAFVISYARFARSTTRIVDFLARQSSVEALSFDDPPSGVVPALDDIRDAALHAFKRLAEAHKTALEVIRDMPHDFGNAVAELSARISNGGPALSQQALQSALSEAAVQFREVSDFQMNLYSTRLETDARNLGAWLAEYLDDEVHEEFADHGLTLVMSAPDDLRARFSKTALSTILDNLRGNAMKYTDSPGEVRFEVLARGAEPCLRVTSAPALPATTAPGVALGQRGIRGAEVADRPGTGVGLFHVHKLMAMMDGHAAFRMIAPQGAAPRMFEVTLRFSA